MSEHTPGPWKWEWSASNVVSIYADVGERQSPEVASVWASGEDGRPCLSAEEMESDARLIAAAPELLDALERLADRFEAMGDAVHTTRTDRRILKAARAAIAKATGADQ